MKTRIEEAAKKYAIEDVFGDDTCKDFQSCITDFIAGAEFVQEELKDKFLEGMTKEVKSIVSRMGIEHCQVNEKLKAQNEIMREALEKIGVSPTPSYIKSASEERTYYLNIATEALKKVGEV